MLWIVFFFCRGLEGFMKDDLQLSIKICDGFFIFKNPIWPPPNPKFEIFAKFNGLGITEYILGVPIMVLRSDLSMCFIRILSFGFKLVVEVTTRGHYIQNDPYFSLCMEKLLKIKKKY